jgi:hypothetical protein
MPPISADEKRLGNLRGRFTSQELRVVLEERIGGPGQMDGASDAPNRFYLPLWGESCRVVLTYDGSEIVGIERGPALGSDAWERLSKEIEHSLIAGPQKVGRDFSFGRYRVVGWWRGVQSGVQILPPPADAPRAPVEMADHPFILEFPLQASDIGYLTHHRRLRDHRRLTLLLNVLLRGGATVPPRRPGHFWAAVPRDNQSFHERLLRILRPLRFIHLRPAPLWDVKWVQEFFFSEQLGHVLIDELSPPSSDRLEEVAPEAYYAALGHDGQGLRVPADLDQSICLYLRLSPAQRDKFDRATFWLDAVSRQWTFSISSSFASLVVALEALTTRGTSHAVTCTKCAWTGPHDVPGATERLRALFEEYAPGVSREFLKRIPKRRGGIFHGGTLMQLDQDRAFGWDPLEFEEMELVRELGGLTKVALRNWLKKPQV